MALGSAVQASDRGDRFYQIHREDVESARALEFEIRASAEFPLVNVPLVVRNWEPGGAVLHIGGEAVPGGRKFRSGQRHELDGSTLVVWIKLDVTASVRIRLTPENL
jgi:hypothetical protein